MSEGAERIWQAMETLSAALAAKDAEIARLRLTLREIRNLQFGSNAIADKAHRLDAAIEFAELTLQE